MAKSPFLAKDGIRTLSDILLANSHSAIKVTSGISDTVNLISKQQLDVVVGDHVSEQCNLQLRADKLYHCPDNSTNYHVFTQGFLPTSNEVVMSSGSTSSPEKMWTNTYATNPHISEAPEKFTTVTNLSLNREQGLQLATSYSNESSNTLWFRSRRETTDGTNLREWNQIYHSGCVPTAHEVGAPTIEQFTALLDEVKQLRAQLNTK